METGVGVGDKRVVVVMIRSGGYYVVAEEHGEGEAKGGGREQ